jgi:hypothetical protein
MPDRVKYLSLTFRKTKTNHEIYFFISGANQNGVDPHNQMHPGQMGQDPMAKQNQMQQPGMQNQQPGMQNQQPGMQNQQQQNQQQMNQQQQPPPPQQQQPPMQQ